ILTRLSCWKGHLPTGSPLSPILSFYAHMDVWEKIAEHGKAEKCKVSVYIDDVTISGPKVSDELMWKIKQEIGRAGLKYHKEKIFTQGWSEITGIIPRDGKLQAPNRTLKEMHELRKSIRSQKNADEKKKLIQKLKSYETHIRQIKKISDGS